MAIDFVFSKDSKEAYTIHIKSDIIKIVIGNETDEII